MALAAAFLVGVQSDVYGTSSTAETATGAPLGVSSPSSPPAASVRLNQSRRLAWAPTAEAAGYHLELFRDGKKVFEVDTVDSLATVPIRWSLDGSAYRLEPGVYAWYVWPVVDGARASRAVVQANLTITT